MKVMFITHSYLVDITRRKLEILADMGIPVTLVTPPRWKHTLKKYNAENSKSGKIEIIKSPTVLDGNNFLYFFQSLKKLIKLARPDIVHVEEEPYSMAAYQAVRAAKELGIKSIFFTWENIYKNHIFPLSYFETYVLKNTDYAIAGNIEAANVLKRKGFKKGITVIPQMGIDTDLFCKRRNRTKQKNFIIGYVGRLAQEKGIEDLLSACSRIEGNWKLRLVGNGPFKIRIASMAAKLGISGRIELAGFVPDDGIATEINKMDCMVLPSRTTPAWKEQFGHVLIEAMSCEVPVIGSNSGAITNVIGQAGIIFPERDADALKNAMTMLIANPALRKRFGTAGRKKVLRDYTWLSIAKKTAKIYGDMV